MLVIKMGTLSPSTNVLTFACEVRILLFDHAMQHVGSQFHSQDEPMPLAVKAESESPNHHGISKNDYLLSSEIMRRHFSLSIFLFLSLTSPHLLTSFHQMRIVLYLIGKLWKISSQGLALSRFPFCNTLSSGRRNAFFPLLYKKHSEIIAHGLLSRN